MFQYIHTQVVWYPEGTDFTMLSVLASAGGYHVLSKVGCVPTVQVSEVTGFASPDVYEVYVPRKVQVPGEAAAVLGLAMPTRPTGLKFSSCGQDNV